GHLLGKEYLLDQLRQLGHARQPMRLRLARQPLSFVESGQHPNHAPHTGIRSGLEIEWRIADIDDVMRAGHACSLHGAKDHEGCGPPPSDIAAGNIAAKVSHQPAESRINRATSR